MRKKLLFIIDSLGCGGAERSLVSLLPLIDQRQYDIHLWIRSRGGAFERLVPPGVTIEPEPTYSFAGRTALTLSRLLFSLMLRLNRLLRNGEYAEETQWKCQGRALAVPKGDWHAVVAYQQGVPTYMAATKFPGCRTVAWVNADIYNMGFSPRFNTRYYERIDRVVAVSPKLRQMLAERMPTVADRLRLVYDILNPDVIRQSAKESAPDIRCHGGLTLVTAGRLVPVKGYDLAVEAAARLKSRGIKLRWCFVGDGPERDNILRQAEELGVGEEITLAGFQPNPYAYLAQADIYVQTSRFEGFCLTIGEAKILGKPVVSTRFDVAKNQINDGINGLLADINPQSIADAIQTLSADQALRQRLAAAVAQETNTTSVSEIEKFYTIISD